MEKEGRGGLDARPDRPTQKVSTRAEVAPDEVERIRQELLDELREMEPYRRLSAVGLTITECHRDGETWTEVRDKSNSPGGRQRG